MAMLTYATKQKHEKKVLEGTAWNGAASLSKQKRSTTCNLCVNLDWDRCYFYPHRWYWNIWNAWTPGWEGSRRFTLWAGTLYVLLRGWHKLPFGNADVALLCRLQMLTSHNQQLCHKVGRALPFTLLCALTLCKPEYCHCCQQPLWELRNYMLEFLRCKIAISLVAPPQRLAVKAAVTPANLCQAQINRSKTWSEWKKCAAHCCTLCGILSPGWESKCGPNMYWCSWRTLSPWNWIPHCCWVAKLC